MTRGDSAVEPRPVSGLPGRNEAASYYYKYIDRISGDDIVGILDAQKDEALAFLKRISEEESLHQYAPDKWSIRGVLSHVNDTERVFAFRALWFARGFDSPLPSFDQDASSVEAGADETSWAGHLEDFRAVRSATVSLLRNLPAGAWARTGIASDNPFSVRAIAYIAAGHLAHHLAVIRERYGKA
jgi:DinB superfamily